MKDFLKKNTSETLSNILINKSYVKDINFNNFLTYILIDESKSSLNKNVKIINIKKQMNDEKNIFQVNSENVNEKNKNLSSEIKKISNFQIMNFTSYENKRNLLFEKSIHKNQNLFSKNCNQLLKLFKKYFFRGDSSNFEKNIKKLNPAEKIFIIKILSIDQDFALKDDYILEKKMQRSLKTILNLEISRFYNKKKLNFIRKIFKIILNRIKNKRISELKNLNLNYKKSNLLDNLFQFNNNQELKNMIMNCLKEFKKNDSLLCFSFPFFTKEFNLHLELLMKEKWEDFREIFKLKFSANNLFGIEKDILFQKKLEDICLYSSGYIYLKKIYTCVIY